MHDDDEPSEERIGEDAEVWLERKKARELAFPSFSSASRSLRHPPSSRARSWGARGARGFQSGPLVCSFRVGKREARSKLRLLVSGGKIRERSKMKCEERAQKKEEEAQKKKKKRKRSSLKLSFFFQWRRSSRRSSWYVSLSLLPRRHDEDSAHARARISHCWSRANERKREEDSDEKWTCEIQKKGIATLAPLSLSLLLSPPFIPAPRASASPPKPT